MPRMNCDWRPCQWLALSLMTALLAGCAPTTERTNTDATSTEAVVQTTATPSRGRVGSRELGADGYDLARPATKPSADADSEWANMAVPIDNYINSRYRDRGLGVRAARAPVEPEVSAEDPDKYELKPPARDSDQQGKASWYGEQFHGRRTASGERFDLNELTAAHKSLPFGTRVCVRSNVTGKTVVVRINDRGPFAPGRVIDLSKAAAQELGMLGLGIKPVEIWRLAKGEAECPEVVNAAAKRNANATAKNVKASKPVKTMAASAKTSPRKTAQNKPRK